MSTKQQPTAEITELPTEALETEDHEFRSHDNGEVPLVHNNTVLTDDRAIHARQQHLNHSKQKLEEADALTKRETIQTHKERANDLETSLVATIPTHTEGTKRGIIDTLVDTNLNDCDSRLLTSILYAHNHDQVTDITPSEKFVIFTLDDDTHIEATSLGDGIVIQGRTKHLGHEIARSFPETHLQENEILETIRNLLDPQNGWAIF